MSIEKHSYSWQRLSQAKRASAIYAWYYTPLIPSAEIDHCCQQIHAYKAKGDYASARGTVDELLRHHVLTPLAPLEYNVRLTAELGPPYVGTAHYDPVLGSSFLDKFVSDPPRLYALRLSLATADSRLQAPLYIGKATNLRTRLYAHKQSIQTGRFRRSESDLDKSFAKEVRRRGLLSTRLSVEALYNPQAPPEDLEYVLNRSTFPAFGRK